MYNFDRNGYGGYWLGYGGIGYNIYASNDGYIVKRNLDNEEADYEAETMEEAIEWVLDNGSI